MNDENTMHQQPTQANAVQNVASGVSTVARSENAVVSNTNEEEQKKYILTKKFEDWVMYFTTKGYSIEVNGQKRNTYGNRTTSAIKAYDLDPVKQYNSACVIGSENFRKLKDAGSMFAEDLGLTYDFMLDVGKAKLGEKGTKMWELMMDTLGYREMKAEPTPQGGTQNNTFNITVNEAQDFESSFKKFLESQ